MLIKLAKAAYVKIQKEIRSNSEDMQIRQFSFENISWPLVDLAFRYVWYQTMSIMLELALIFGGFSLSANPHSLTDVANIFVNANSKRQ